MALVVDKLKGRDIAAWISQHRMKSLQSIQYSIWIRIECMKCTASPVITINVSIRPLSLTQTRTLAYRECC